MTKYGENGGVFPFCLLQNKSRKSVSVREKKNPQAFIRKILRRDIETKTYSCEGQTFAQPVLRSECSK